MKNWRVDDVMTKVVVSVSPGASYRELVDLLVQHRFSAVPVVDEFQRVRGVVSEADLLRKIEYAGETVPRLFERRHRRDDRVKGVGRTANELMSSPAVTAPSGSSLVAAARLMDQEQVKRLPVVDDMGRLIGVVARSDLLKVHLRPDDEIRSDIESGILRTYPAEEADGIVAEVSEGVVTLIGRVARFSTIDAVGRLVRQVPGVVDVIEKVDFDYDDRDIPATGIGFGMA
ncbi:CBS domain-containing protein [Actinoplanes sp. NPDC051633]|uniref:CBS domain-containing protein n=1 Tax=Actinoplanes sp. NPDC051633 TaxID=3155670 RepID=UPI00342E2A31